MERQDALKELNSIVGKDLRKLADSYNVTVFAENGEKNKGWAGHVLERHLCLPLNSSRAPNFGSWELKTISLKYLKSGALTVKETMAITMIDPYCIEHRTFEESHLYSKLKKQIIAARIWIDKTEPSSILHSVTTFDLDDPAIYEQVKNDYDVVRNTIRNDGFLSLSGKMGVFIQPRTKGRGHGSTTRAFYARTKFLKQIIFDEDIL